MKAPRKKVKALPHQDFDALVADAARLDNMAWSSDFNLFRILRMAQFEIRHSMVLAWLLEPTESHGLNSRFLARMLKFFRCELPKSQIVLFLKTVSVKREQDHLDLVLVSEKLKVIIVLENKVKAKEGPNQLDRYYKRVENHNVYKDYKRYYVFLTPDGRSPSSEKMCQIWQPCSYHDVYTVLQHLYNDVHGNGSCKCDAEVLFRNYLTVLKEDVLNMVDKGERKRYEDFYRKHKAALDRLYEVVHPGVAAEMWQALHSLSADEEFIRLGFLLPPESRWGKSPTFCVKALDEYLGKVKGKRGSWGDERAYSCEFKIDYGNDRICCNFVLGGVNCSQNLVEKLKRISDFPKGFRAGMSIDEACQLATSGKRGVQYHSCKWNGTRKHWEEYAEQGVSEATRKVVRQFLNWVKIACPKWRGSDI
jgi:hypothetical protein